MYKCFEELFYTFVESPTRSEAFLDLVITNNAELITNVDIKENLGSSEHNMI